MYKNVMAPPKSATTTLDVLAPLDGLLIDA